MILPTQTEVLIVGAGPVGITLANLLGQYGISVLIVDKAGEILTHPRAIALDNEALRILQLAGLGEDAFAKIAIPTIRMRSPYVGEFAQANMTGCLDGHPKLVTFFQPELEQALHDSVQQYPHVQVFRGTELVSFTEHTAGFSVELRTPEGGVHALQAVYLVGADGAASLVRQTLGLEFHGQSYAEDWLVIDAKHRPNPIDHVQFLCDPRRPVPHMIAPGNRERWEFMLQPGENREQILAPERIKQLLQPWFENGEGEIERAAIYRFHARVVERFQKGRAFLVGDAAHITPPFAGQGLCAGLRDAANLGWKLAWVLRERAAPSILDSYDIERRPHATSMIRMATVMGKLVMPSNGLAAIALHGLVRLMRLFPPTRPLVEEFKIKPQNRFDKGLFIKGSSSTRLVRGSHFPQNLLRHEDGRYRLSDDVLGQRLTLVGFGIDPEGLLDVPTAERWRAAGGGFVQICHRGQRLHRHNEENVWEDVTGEFLPNLAPLGWGAVVRPDRTVVNDGPGSEAGLLVRECLTLLGVITASSIGLMPASCEEKAA